jgi:hypothetical protein
MTTPFPFVAGAVLQASQLNAITTLPINDQTASYTLVVGDVGKRVVMMSRQRTPSRSTTRSSQRATPSKSSTKARPRQHSPPGRA